MESFERTLVIVKPDAMKHRDQIACRIKEAGFVIVQSRTVVLTAEQASEFYRSKQTHLNYHGLIVTLSEGPILAMCVSKQNAIRDMLWLIGPETYQDAVKNAPLSLRAIFADRNEELRNAVHASEDKNSACFEIQFFFPTLLQQPIFSEENLKNYLAEAIHPVLMQGLYTMAKERPENPLAWLSSWLVLNNPYKPKLISELTDVKDHGAPMPKFNQEYRHLDVTVSQTSEKSRCDCCEYKDNGICPC